MSIRSQSALLWCLALAVSAFTLRRVLDPFDEGLLLLAAERMRDGQLPYVDFVWAYGPGLPALGALIGELFGPNLLWWRIVRSAVDATTAVLAFALVRELIGRDGLPGGGRRAATAWPWIVGLSVAVVVAQPTSANPAAGAWCAALGAVLAAVRGHRVTAGALVAAVAALRPDTAVWAALAVAAALVLVPGAGRGRGVLRAGAAALVGVLVVYGAPLLADGPVALITALTGDLDDATAWRLPFPWRYGGPLTAWPPTDALRDGKDLLGFYQPLLALAGFVVAAALWLRGRPAREEQPGVQPAVGGLVVLGIGATQYLLGRTDDLHQQPLLVITLILLGAGASGLRVSAAPWLRPVAVGLLGAMALAGVANRASALLLAPDLRPLSVPGSGGVRVPPADAAALPALVADVQRRTAPGEAIYVAPLRSDLVTLTAPIIHALVRRPNVLDQDADLLHRASVQGEIVATLRRRPPRVIVRWADPRSSRPEANERGRPSGVRLLGVFLAARYREAARYGAYVVLVPR